MPLSEQEQRLLEEMERSLYQNDSDFVARVTRRQGRPTYTAITLGVLGALAGIAVVIVGLVIKAPLLGILGFVVMLAGVLFALRPGMRAPKAKPARPGKPASGGSARPSASGGGGSFMDRMNDRWDKRNDQGQ
ncbi:MULTISPECIES: DUF3040 domain-containing protein [Curtobacterium]|jgi:hypothetical protein|uniref:DUF3040 domain-containing protein n=1 Tax=Curtobacterium flaccumfaciens pv. flaccumfaciens TaxID=138532 RepID=A0A9Q2W2G1_9MICO|nr:DUF3040 domain-containing protein [Curtobacterium flaccumfaciens]MBT1542132.1 DUF3040 domain-containing protein [Curtobacterium flaccumfaciens pv. flaccumfaciens]MBT1598549.1 DUF3040 domain-containing protein [Curtobacterium flaccumfaciens pv. flaccumfaciens]MCS6575533.1 DUF3040 domain-containing protein [Curtobacterium flaccumfaciens pv. flaccumfaciens]MCU0114774.1 DUF3040 domain-containing protein [Curtobacterium flaccumfaciens]MCU0154466.1 DUF3040 domain-containing protein [Curtobacteriu